MNRVLLLLGAAGLIALLAWVTLSDDRAEEPAGKPRPRDAEREVVVNPGVVKAEPTKVDGGAEPPAPARTDGGITGVIVDPEGLAYPGARIAATPIGGETRSAKSDGTGRFRIPVAAGQVTLSIESDHYPPRIRVVSAPVDLGEIRMEKGYEIAGRVIDPEGEGVRGVTVRADGLTHFSATTDEEGRFRILRVHKHPHLLVAAAIEAKMVGEPVEVTPPATDVVLTVKRLRMGYGLVVSEEGDKPVPGATVRLTLSTGGWSQVEADEMGRFAFDLTDARYSDPRLRFTVLVTATGFEDATTADLTLEQVRPAADLSVKLVRAVVVEPGRLRGRVLYDTGAPFHGSLTLSISREGKAGEIFRIQTNEKGEFLVPKITPGEYVLRSAPHGESILRETGKTLRIPPGGEETTEFTLTRGGDLKLTITGPDGSPVKEAAVSILDEKGAEQRSFIVPDGTGVIPDLVPGKVRVRVSKAGHETVETEVTVVKDQVTDAAVRLSEDR